MGMRVVFAWSVRVRVRHGCRRGTSGRRCTAHLHVIVRILLTNSRGTNFSSLLSQATALSSSPIAGIHRRNSLYRKQKSFNMTNGLVNGGDVEGQFGVFCVKHHTRRSLTKHRFHSAALGLNRSTYVPPHMRRAAAAAVAPPPATLNNRYTLSFVMPQLILIDVIVNPKAGLTIVLQRHPRAVAAILTLEGTLLHLTEEVEAQSSTILAEVVVAAGLLPHLRLAGLLVLLMLPPVASPCSVLALGEMENISLADAI